MLICRENIVTCIDNQKLSYTFKEHAHTYFRHIDCFQVQVHCSISEYVRGFYNRKGSYLMKLLWIYSQTCQ